MHISRRSLQAALGGVWLIDAGLQLQPYMFGPHFAHDVIGGAASGQPGWIAGTVHAASALIAHAPVWGNVTFAGIQAAIGAGLLWSRTSRVALGASIAWAGGIWLFGEGLGGLAGGHASLLTGLPGAVLLYAVLAVAAWPQRGDPLDGRAPAPLVLGAWALAWATGALFQLLPGQSSAGQLAATVTGGGTGAPAWLSGVDAAIGHWLERVGPAGVGVLVVVELAIGLGALSSRRLARWASIAGAFAALAIWVVGEAFGQVLSGHSTDPNSGPLLVLLALVTYSAADAMDDRHWAGLHTLLVYLPDRRRSPRSTVTPLITLDRPHTPTPALVNVTRDVGRMAEYEASGASSV